MQKVIFFLLFVLFSFNFSSLAFAQEITPMAVNNKFGVHILFPEEINEAAQLVNSNGGDWGYITIPIQSGDKNIEKWQKFMDDARSLHVIPLIRLATEGDYFNTKVWRKPNFSDVLDFANFLNSLQWPTKNRYVIIFNEVNRGDEWGGSPNPSEYADILSYAVTVFKSKSSEFFILSNGFDNASITISDVSINEYEFMEKMSEKVPGIFNQVDGIASHSYPNPAFAKPPSQQDKMSVASFLYEKRFIQNLGSRDMPVFITETGWSQDVVSDSKVAQYYEEAFLNVWSNKDVMAVTPFLLRANTKPFSVFSLLKMDGGKTLQYEAIEKLEKAKGTPLINNAAPKEEVLGEKTVSLYTSLPTKYFNTVSNPSSLTVPPPTPLLKTVIKWLFKI